MYGQRKTEDLNKEKILEDNFENIKGGNENIPVPIFLMKLCNTPLFQSVLK